MNSSSEASEERHLANLVYHLGYYAARLPILVVVHWQCADGEHPVPEYLEQLVPLIQNNATDLANWPAWRRKRGLKKRANSVCALLDKAWGLLRESWNGPAHLELIRSEILAEASIVDPLRREHSPIETEDWAAFANAARDFLAQLPDKYSTWAALGQNLALGSTLFYDEEGWKRAAMKLASLYSRLADQPVLSGMPLDVSDSAFRLRGPWLSANLFAYQDLAIRQIADFHWRLSPRLQGLVPVSIAARSEASDETSDGTVLSEEAKLRMAIEMWNDKRSMKDIASAVGFCRQYLYKWKPFQAAIAIIRRRRS